jgi:hypothetical protein
VLQGSFLVISVFLQQERGYSAIPRPRSFFSWIVGLVTLVGVVLPVAPTGLPAASWRPP